jgi:hypothetical protein
MEVLEHEGTEALSRSSTRNLERATTARRIAQLDQ